MPPAAQMATMLQHRRLPGRCGCGIRCRVLNEDFSDAALVLLGHGSTRQAQSTVTTYQHAAELRRRGFFREVREAFWLVEPKVSDLWERIRAPRVFILPLFLSAGYFTEEALPVALGLKTEQASEFPRVQRRGDQTIHYCRPLGDHSRLTEVIRARARDVMGQSQGGATFLSPQTAACGDEDVAPPGESALILAGHGTTKSDQSRQNLDRQVALLRARNLYAEVHGVFLEEAPHIEECYSLARAANLVVVPFLISDGAHTMEDLPMRLGEPAELVRARLRAGEFSWRNPIERCGKRIWLARCLGTEPMLAELILDRVREISRTKCSA